MGTYHEGPLGTEILRFDTSVDVTIHCGHYFHPSRERVKSRTRKRERAAGYEGEEPALAHDRDFPKLGLALNIRVRV